MFSIPKDKKNQDYKRYLEGLYDYLYDFLQRVKPLLDLEGEIKSTERDFEQKWNDGTFPGWMVSQNENFKTELFSILNIF